MKKRIFVIFLALTMCMPLFRTDAFAAVNYKWTYDRSSAVLEEQVGWGGDNAKFSVDTTIHTASSPYSIKIENLDYNTSCVQKTYDVQPFTHYKFSAMVKYSDFQINPDDEFQISGAVVGKAYKVNNVEYFAYPGDISEYSSSTEWTKVEYEFTTRNETTVNLCLQNGGYCAGCKGTAWFSEVKLEKGNLTNNWNILAVIFKDVDATVKVNGKTVTQKNSISKDDDDFIRNVTLAPLPQSLKECSDGKMGVNSLDIYTVDKTITEKELTEFGSGYRIDESAVLISNTLDTYLAEKRYNQIILIAPLGGEIAPDWFGLGGTKYKSAEFLQIDYVRYFFSDPFDDVYIHEMAHGLERMSREINKDTTPVLHDREIYYQGDNAITNREWYKIYMSATILSDGKQLNPSVYNVLNGEYTLVSDDMTTGVGIKNKKSSAPKALRAKSVSDKKILLDWDAVSGASEYQIVQFKNVDRKKIAKSVQFNADLLSITVGPYKKGKTYYFGVRAVNGGCYSDWTYLTFKHIGTKK